MKKYINEIKGFIIIDILSDAVTAGAIALIPYLQKILFDSITEGKDVNLIFFILLFISCVVVIVVFSYIGMLFMWKGKVHFEKALKKDLFKVISSYSFKRFSSKDIGEYISLQGNEISELERKYLHPIVDMLKAINVFVIYGITLFIFVDWRVALVIFILSIISVMVFPKITSKELSKRNIEYFDKMGKYVAKMKDLLEGFKLIKKATRDNIISEHEIILEDTYKNKFHYGKMESLADIINKSSTWFVNGIAFALIGYLFLKKEITIGTAIASFGYMGCFTTPIEFIIYDLNQINSTKEIKVKLLGFLKTEPTGEIITKKEFHSHIEFKNISIQYESFSIENLSYKFEKGKKYAVIGYSGSGKSTIMRALMKYEELNAGEILIDGKNINEIDTSNIICCINQDEYMYASNFRDNATLFSSYSDSRINTFKRIIQKKMMDLITEKENCKLLSGGEKQIIGITRMHLADKPICILDEPFSATDMNTTKRLNEFIMTMDDKTIIMITHKLTPQLSEFDEILIMKYGKIVDHGTYEEISKSNEFNILQSIGS